MAINDSYIAVGDPKANRVAIYSYSKTEKQWSRTREIYPPKNSIIDRVGYGFGHSLIFHQNQLIISAYSQPKSEIIGAEPATEESKLAKEYHGAVYSLLLETNKRSFLQEIALPDPFKLTGYSLTIFNNKIALGATTEKQPYTNPSTKPGKKVLIVNPTTLEVETIIEPPSPEQKFADFGFVIDGNDDFLLVGSRGLSKKGGALLIDKAGKITEISSVKDPTSILLRAGASAAIADNFMVVGNTYGSGAEYGSRAEAVNTLFLRQSYRTWSLVDIVNFGGSHDTANSYVLISTDRETSMPTSTFHLIHMLVKLDKNGAEIKSKIRWKWMPDYKYEGKGIIHNNHLLLSHKGKIVLLSMQNLPRNYVINRSFCNKK
ncbi:MAG: hypothetical protein AAFN00_21210 [Cyanobacteria bacterium J06558_2]